MIKGFYKNNQTENYIINNINFQSVKIGDTLIFTPISTENSIFPKDNITIDELYSYAEILTKAFPQCKVIVSPIEFNLKVVRIEE